MSDAMNEEMIKVAIENCFMTRQYGNPGMEEGMCAGLRTLYGEGEPTENCKSCVLQYQHESD